MATEMIVPEWMHEQITAEQYDSWPEERCRDTEIVDGMVTVRLRPSKRHNRLATRLAHALDAAGRPIWLADTDFDVRLRDVSLVNRRPDVTLYRAEAIDVAPTRPEHVLLIAEVVAPGSETEDRVTKPVQYARAGIKYYWRVENATTQLPVVHTYRLDEAEQVYRATDVFTGIVKAVAPFPVEIDLTAL